MHLVFIADMLGNFLVATRDDAGNMVFEPCDIARRYIFSRRFFIDLLSVLPAAGLSGARVRSTNSDTSRELTKALRIFRLAKLHRAESLVEFGPLVAFLFMVSHWAACAWKALEDDWRCGEDGLHPEGCTDGFLGGYLKCLMQGWLSLLMGGGHVARYSAHKHGHAGGGQTSSGPS